MAYLTLDLSLKCTGWSKFSSDGKLLDRGRIEPAEDLPNCLKVHQVAKKCRELFENIEDLIIEDIYLGRNVKTLVWLARLSGAVATEWVDYSYRIPLFYPANTARKLVGLKGNCHKAEAQLFILKKYNFADKKTIQKFKGQLKEYKKKYDDGEHTKGKYKYRLGKLSKAIDEETGIGQDVADSAILGLAYLEDIK